MSNSDDILWRVKHFDELSVHELYAIMRARQEVFVVEQECAYLDADGKDPHSSHLFAFCGGATNEIVAASKDSGGVVAYCRLVPPKVSYPEPSIGRVVTSKNFRGRKLGHELIARAIAECRRLYGNCGNRISAQAYLEHFYSHHGFRTVRGPYMEDGIPHLEMVRSAD